MKRYGQFCSIALALEVVGERWTFLVLREILMGSTRFNDIRRGNPLMSPTLLSTRLRTLEDAGVIEKRVEDGRPAYHPTPAGLELEPVLRQLGAWGKRWAHQGLDEQARDPALLMWDMRRNLRLEQLPRERTVLFFHYPDAPTGKGSFWFRIAGGSAELCLIDPGGEVELDVRTAVATMQDVWMGHRPLDGALSNGAIRLEGAADLQRSFPAWIGLSAFAPVPPAS